MSFFYSFLNLLFISIIIGAGSMAYAGGEHNEEQSVVTSVVKDREYHHLEYILKQENILSLELLTDNQIRANGGQFEVFIRKSMFPIEAPKCETAISLRMPWTNPKLADHQLFIDEKQKMYSKIKRVYEHGDSHGTHIVIELNPYVEKVSEGFKLTQCNVFFRHARGRYISYIGSLKQ